MSFTIKPATRQGVKALVGFYGKSGSGKTMSSLLFARGLVGPKGRIVLIDTENKRGHIFADLIPGSYEVIDFDAPFSPERYEDAITEAEKNADIIVIDSLSHEWSGEGGVLDMQEDELKRMAGDNWAKREQCKMASWIKPKMLHKHMVNRILRCALPLICCLRGEEKTHMLKGDDGKNKVVTDQFSSPLFDPRFIFEMLINMETINRDGKGGYVYIVKCTHPSIAPLLPSDSEQVGVKHGEAMAKWCAAPGTTPVSTPASTSAPAPQQSSATPKERMLAQLQPFSETLIKEFAVQKGWLMPMETSEDWPETRVPKTHGQMKTLLAEIEKFKTEGTVTK